MNNFLAIIAVLLGGAALVCVIAILFAYPFMLLWNGCLVGAVTGINQIGFWQALGLMILCGFMFKSHSSSSKKS